MLGECGLAHVPQASARVLVGKGARALIARGFALAGEPLPDEAIGGLVSRFIEVYRARIADESLAFDGVEPALRELGAAGARLCVCTNKRTDLSMALLDALQLTPLFVSVTGADKAPKPKPDPSHMLAAIAQAGGDPASALMVGDSDNDVRSAKSAGIPVVVVDFGYTETPPDQLGGNALIGRFAELPALAHALLSARGACRPSAAPL